MYLIYLVKVSFVLAVLTLSFRWLIQYETFSKLNRLFLVFNVVIAWLLPLTPLTNWGPTEVQKEFHSAIPRISEEVPQLLMSKSTEYGFKNNENSTTDADWDWQTYALLVYCLGAAFMAIRFLYLMGKISYLIYSSPTQKLDNGVNLVDHGPTKSPFSFFKWIICNPCNHSKDEFDHIMAHESEHMRQWHSLDLLLAELQKIALWFNPFAWRYQKQVQENLEYLADQAVLQNGHEKRTYQFSLLNATLQSQNIPLTNSFAQSLLKKRIKMMNRKPSKRWALGKYALLVVLIYSSSAFVAPYRQQIVALVPAAAQPMVETILPSEEGRAEPMVPKTESSIISLSEEIVDSPEFVQTPDSTLIKTKGVLIQNGTLYWAISPLSTWEDIDRIKTEIENFGATMTISTLKFDPLQLFITSLGVRVKSGGSSGFGDRENLDSSRFSPIVGYSGYIEKGGLGMGQSPPQPLENWMKNDYEKAMTVKKANEINFREYEFANKLGSVSSSGWEIDENMKPATVKSLSRSGFGRSNENMLRIEAPLNDANFYLNGEKTGRSSVNLVEWKKVSKIRVYEDGNMKKHVWIVTK